MLRSLKSLLEPTFEIVSMSDNILSLADAIEDLEPDLTIVDLSMGIGAERNAVRHLKNRFPDVKIIVLAEDDDPVVVRESLASGSAGYVLKPFAATEMVPAIETVARGENYVPPACDLDDPQAPTREERTLR